MHKSKQIIISAALAAFVLTQSARLAHAQDAGCPAQAEKKVADNTEYDLSNEAFKHVDNAAQQIKDLDAWTAKYPNSDYKDTRLYMYMQAYSKVTPPQPEKVLDYGSQLLSKDLKCIFAKQPNAPLSVLFLMDSAFLQLPSPTPAQIADAGKIARQLLDQAKTFFAADKKPANTSDADWTKARVQIETVANATLVHAQAAPGLVAMAKQPPDCAAAEAAFTKTLQEYPESPGSADIAYNLGKALICQQESKPQEVSKALYEIARAVSLDPAKGGLDPQARTQIDAYLAKIYATYHGSNDGLDQLKQQASAAPFPPAGFAIRSKAEIDAEQAQQFAKNNPELALWKGIRDQLAAPSGQQYFDSQLKGAGVPTLKGTLVEAKPACRSRQLLVAVPLPGAPSTAEITLNLEAPLTGKPETGVEIQWEGVPSAFTQSPFMLTMDTEKADVKNLTVTPCGAAPKPAPAKKK